MDKLDQILADLKATTAKIDALLEGKSALSAEEQAEHDRLAADADRLTAAAERERARLEREAKAAKVSAGADRLRAARAAVVGSGRLTDADAPPVRVSGDGLRDAIPAEVKRYGSLKNFRGTRKGRDADLRAYRFGMFMLARLSYDMPNRYRFGHAQEWVQRSMSASKSKDATGLSYLIPEEFGDDLIDLRERYGVARRLFKMVPMASDTRTDPRRQGGLTAYFVSEGAAGTESNKLWDDVRLTAKDIMVLSRYTSQVNADAVINLGDDLAGEIAYAFSNKEDDCAFNGDATSTYGGIVGVRTKLQDVDGSGTDSAGLVTGAGNAYSELVLADFQNVAGKLPVYADGPDVAWLCHKSFYYSVMQRLELAAGGVTALEIQQGDRRPRPLFLGYPVEFSQIYPSTEANSQVCATLGNYVQGASFGDRQSDEVSFSEHATIGGENVFERNQIAIRGTERIDINVHDVGTSAAAGPIVGLQTAAS